MKLLNQSVTPVRGPVDPVPIDNTLKITKRVELATAAGAPLGVTGALLFTALQGSNTLFDALRVQKVSVYDEAGAGSTVAIAFPGQDEANYIDHGTQGQKRAQIHLMPSFNQRQTWLSGSSAVQFTVTTTGVGLIQVTIEARASTAGDP